MKYTLIGTLTYNIWVDVAPVDKLLGKKNVPCPVYAVDWKAMERNKYAPWGRGAK